LELRPFPTSRTYANLRAHPDGVLHVTDDVLLLARAAIGAIETLPTLVSTTVVRGQILQDACRAYEFRCVSFDNSAQRVSIQAEIVATHRFRDFFGLNRAMFAVVEAAILATRVSHLPLEEILAEYTRLAVLVQKTGGPREHEAFAFLQDYVERQRPVDSA
jgi:hypothetical protein